MEILDKLEGLIPRFEEVSTLITDPNVIADQKRYVQLTKEYKNLEDIMKARQEYINAVKGLEEAKDLLANEDDAEMKEMAREEISINEKRIPQLEEEIKLLLIPADPEDSKNVTLEIRGGTGGDEAALFAGDLFRMYSKFCEIKGWHLKLDRKKAEMLGLTPKVVFQTLQNKLASYYGTSTAHSNTSRASTECNECQPPRHRDASTPQLPP